MPGSARTTWGMAFTTCMAVARQPAWLWSPRSESSSSSILRCGSPSIEHPVAAALRPVGRVVVAQAGDVLHHDALLAADQADDLEAHAGDRPLLDRAGRDLEVLVGAEDLVGLLHLVELAGRWPTPTRCSTGPHASEMEPGREEQRLRRVLLPEAHDLEHRERVVPRVVVDDLHHPDLAHLLAEGEGVDGEPGVAEARVDARRVEARAALEARGLELLGDALARGRAGTAAARTTCSPRSCRSASMPDDVVDHAVGPEVGVGGVADAVGVEVEQRVGVLGGEHARRADRRTARRRRGRPCCRSAPRARPARAAGGRRWRARRGCRRCRSPTGSRG